MKLPIFMLLEKSVSKNRAVMVWKGYHNVIHFIISSNLYTLSIINLDIFRLGYILSLSID